MQINSIDMRRFSKDLEIEDFKLSQINLLVGLSGVGKTQLLKMIYSLKQIIMEETAGLQGLRWKVYFSNEGGEEKDVEKVVGYVWSGAFSTEKKNGLPVIESEELFANDSKIFVREGSVVEYKGMKMPKISETKSVMCIFTEEDEIKDAYKQIMHIHFMSNVGNVRKSVPVSWVTEHKDNFKNQEELINSNFSAIYKLAMAYELGFEIVQEIKEVYIDIFHQVEDVRFDIDKDKDVCYLSIKEHNTDWIGQDGVSSGMYKTLMFLAEIYLLKSDSVVLIDEFENSLGNNCIASVADVINSNDRDMQFIITSHHPYIINNIDVSNWKIVTRSGSKIFVKDASELNLGKSRHELFKSLMNTREFNDGIR